MSACPVAQYGRRSTSELAGRESSVRAASGARCLLLTGMVSVRGSGRIDGQVRSVSQWLPSEDARLSMRRRTIPEIQASQKRDHGQPVAALMHFSYQYHYQYQYQFQ